MSIENNNTKIFNLPGHIQIQSWMYKNPRLDRSSLLLAGFLFSLHINGKKITVSNAYLMQLLSVQERQVRYDLDLLEKEGYIKRDQTGPKRRIKWLYIPESEIFIVQDSDYPAIQCPPTRQSSAGLPGNPVPPYNKDNNKEKEIKDLGDFQKSPTKKIPAHKKDERFRRFYDAYPKHEKPGDALKAFRSIIGNDDDLLDLILKDIEIRKLKHSQWQDKKYIENPASYLRAFSFDGEILNEKEELIIKTEQKRIENEKRQLEQERASQLRADEIRKNNESKYKDATIYRKTINSIPTERPEGLKNLRKIVGKI